MAVTELALAETVPCPRCLGSGGYTIMACGPDFSGLVEMPCLICQGAKVVSPDAAEKYDARQIHAKAIRTARRARGELPSDAADRLGIPLGEYGRIELGLIDPPAGVTV